MCIVRSCRDVRNEKPHFTLYASDPKSDASLLRQACTQNVTIISITITTTIAIAIAITLPVQRHSNCGLKAPKLPKVAPLAGTRIGPKRARTAQGEHDLGTPPHREPRIVGFGVQGPQTPKSNPRPACPSCEC